MKPKVAFIVHMLTPYRLSFYEKLFSNEDYEWTLFAGFKQNKVDARPQYEGKVDFPVSYHKEKITSRGIYNMIDNEGMLEAVKSFNADVVIMVAHVGTKSFRDILKWANENNRKVVMWTCFWEPYYIKGYKKLIRDYFIKSFYNKADYHITYSSLARERLIKIGFPEEKISIAYNGVDVDFYKNDLSQDIEENVFDQNSVNFLYVGGFGKDKKVDLLIQAIHRYQTSNSRNIKAYLIGDGPTLNECKQLANQLHLTDNIIFLGRITLQLGKYIKAADCVVLPGTGGLILNEAILFQKPFIVSDADGTENDLLINGFNGVKFLPNSATSLTNAITEVTENLSFFQENATKVTDIVTKRSNVNAMVTTFLKVLNKITNEDINSGRSTAQLYENSAHN